MRDWFSVNLIMKTLKSLLKKFYQWWWSQGHFEWNRLQTLCLSKLRPLKRNMEFWIRYMNLIGILFPLHRLIMWYLKFLIDFNKNLNNYNCKFIKKSSSNRLNFLINITISSIQKNIHFLELWLNIKFVDKKTLNKILIMILFSKIRKYILFST